MSDSSKFEEFKKKKLADIKDEVREFHPLLESLFKRMKTITRVEYTHGPSEMGADFVLSLSHPILNTERYIGVIVKVGKIKQDNIDLERQVKECSIARFFENGKKEIFVDEIWVVCNGSISNNAKKVIRGFSNLRSVEFLGAGEIENLIDVHFPSYWTDLPIHISEYLSKTREKNLQHERNSSLLLVDNNDFYVEQDIYENRNSKFDLENQFKRKNVKVNIFEKIKNHKITLIEGSMGTGKSRLFRKIISHFTTPSIFQDEKLLPLLISYKDLIDAYNNDINAVVNDFIDEKLKEEIGEDVTYLILIDGIDEKKFTTEEELEKLTEIIYKLDGTPNTKFVMASRPLSSFDEVEGLSENLAKYEIRSLSIAKVIEFIRNVCKQLNITQRIIEDLKKSQLFRDLPQSPISAILLAKLIDEHSKELPSNMTELFSKYTELVLGKWDIEKGLQSQKEYQAAITFSMNLAEYFIENELNKISIDEARQRLNDYLKPRNLGLDTDLLLDKLVNRCEIFGADSTRGVMFFKHKTFAEFLYAKKITDSKQLQIDERAFTTYWNNVFYFCIGILRDCPDFLEELTNFPVDSEGGKVAKIANLPNFYLAGFASPYKVISDGIEKVVLETASYYKDVVSGKEESVFLNFPRVYFFLFINHILVEGLSFDFFEEGLETSALSITDDNSIDDETKAYALFFLNVAYIKLGKDKDFKFLLNKFKKHLPLDVLFAIDIESGSSKLINSSKILQKQSKKFRDAIKSSPSLRNTVQNLVKKPLKELQSKN